MPELRIWRDPKRADDDATIKIRDAIHKSIASRLKMKEDDVVIRVFDVGPLDKNFSIVSIEIITGPGENNCRLDNRIELSKEMSADLIIAGVVPEEWIGPLKTDLWLKILGGGAFLPVGRPDLAH